MSIPPYSGAARTPRRFDPQARLTRWFFGRFFALLLVAISVAEAGLLWWLTSALEVVPFAVYLLAPVALYMLNSRVAANGRQRHRARLGALPRVYHAIALGSLFCFAFLVVDATLWLAAKLVLGAIPADATTVGRVASLGSGIDAAFRWLANAGIATIALSFVYGYSIGQLRLKVRRVRLPLANAPAAWHGLTIAQISDIHVGQNLDPQQLQRFVARVNELQPDIVCITGDIADSPHADMDTFFPILAGLRARHAVFAILGNHDHYANPDRVVEALQRHTSFTVLRDASTTLDLHGHRLSVIGLDDRGRDWARGVLELPYLHRALSEADGASAVLLLCHRPDLFPYAARSGVDLMLSGHTHGGQIAMPWLKGRTRNLAQFVTRFDRGLFELDGKYLYVNCGLGVTGQRIRLCTPREITLIELSAGAAAGA